MRKDKTNASAGMRLKKAGAAVLAAAVAASPSASWVVAQAADSTATNNNTATTNDLTNSDIIDYSKTGSLTIYKYDITAAEAAGDYTQGQNEAEAEAAGEIYASGERDAEVEEIMADYAIEGVQFTYVKCGEIETYSVRNESGGSTIEVVYEIPTGLAEILELDEDDAFDISTANVLSANHCSNTGVLHYSSTQIQDALTAILEADNVLAKTALEEYLYSYGTIDSTTDESVNTVENGNKATNMPLTDSTGYTSVDGLDIGLYLVVETEVPEQVTETVNPWLVSIPYTDADGEEWLYDMYCYPKNQTGNPTLDKSVRNAYTNTLTTTGAYDKNGIETELPVGNSYGTDADEEGEDRNTSNSLIVYNDDSNAENTADTSDEAYIANRGGYTSDGTTAGADGAGYSTDYEYADTTTASEGDVLDYILVSKLPHISSVSTTITEYTFVDVLSPGLTYGQDVKIAFYHDAENANANNTAAADLIWTVTDTDGNWVYHMDEYVDVIVTNVDTGKATSDGTTQLTISMTEAGLALINDVENQLGGNGWVNLQDGKTYYGLSDYYMVVYYTAYVNSDATCVLGDEGNPNNVSLTWGRTSDGYYNSLEDMNYVYSYAIDLTKEFSDDDGDFSEVEFVLYNSTDAYYVVAEEDADNPGTYYVTGKVTSESDATVFTPNSDGQIYINGLEADKYQLTEVATSPGYSLLKDQVVIEITSTDRDIIASVSGVTGLTGDQAEAIIANYHGGIYDENGNLIDDQSTELVQSATKDVNGNTISSGISSTEYTYSADDAANGRTINGSDMQVGPVLKATATVDGVVSDMSSWDVYEWITKYTKNGDSWTQSGDPVLTDVGTDSADASVGLTIVNDKNFLLPQTGGAGLYLITIIGVIVAAGGIYIVTRKKATPAQ